MLLCCYSLSSYSAHILILKGYSNNIVERLFNGSAKAVMVNLLETDGIDETELAELRKLITHKKKEVQE
jgi:predicted transcriptional regulator